MRSSDIEVSGASVSLHHLFKTELYGVKSGDVKSQLELISFRNMQVDTMTAPVGENMTAPAESRRPEKTIQDQYIISNTFRQVEMYVHMTHPFK